MMNKETQELLNTLYEYLTKLERYSNAIKIMSFDRSTICPPQGCEYEDETITMIGELAYKIRKEENYISTIKKLNERIDVLGQYDAHLVELLYRSIQIEERLTPEEYVEVSTKMNLAYSAWVEAKNKNDFEIFKPHLAEVIKVQRRLIDLNPQKKETYYDTMIDDYERGFDINSYDRFFEALKTEIVPLLAKIRKSKVKIRDDFLYRSVPIYKQEIFSHYLMDIIGFDSSKGALSTTEHPFTNSISRYDTRITTHYHENNFISNMFTIIHEGGHAIFGQNEPDEIYDHHLQDSMSMAMHESVSRLYENRLARTRAFIHLIYPKFQELFHEEMGDVSEEELYLAINKVECQPIRTEADELTYSLHILIRYELEKKLANDPDYNLDNLPHDWNELYKKYLFLDPKDDAEGVLQDVHWSSGFGYFPTYAMGNAYNAMYLNKMNEDFSVEKAIEKGDFKTILNWMREHVFKKASLLYPKDWIKDITGRDFTPDDFISYLKEKYSDIYKLN